MAHAIVADGSGKSTLLRLIAGELVPAGGGALILDGRLTQIAPP